MLAALVTALENTKNLQHPLYIYAHIHTSMHATSFAAASKGSLRGLHRQRGIIAVPQADIVSPENLLYANAGENFCIKIASCSISCPTLH